MKKYVVAWVLMMASTMTLYAQPMAKGEERYAVAMADLWDNWYVQVGLDMSLQNPCGYNFAKVFPNGKTFGVNAAVGRWFTPGLGLRGKVNWENGIPLFENGHANWLAPFDQPGVHMDRGGNLTLLGDVQFDVHNLFYGYDAERKWHLQLFPRAGVGYNFGVSKGTPILGIGVGNTYQLTEKWGLYADVAYQMTSSGFIPAETGTGSNSNGYFEIQVGVQINLGEKGF
ncbi:MAG: hypothetical protein IKA75_02475 [Bacteroidaceae bacterium]|nr:hypothetical protein [Bacteroidaceae bacterium]